MVGDAGWGLVVAADDEAASGGDRQQALELGAHDGFTLVHGHFVEVADEAHARVVGAQLVHIDAGLTLQREDALESGSFEPVGGGGDVPVGVDDGEDAAAAEFGEEHLVVRLHELVEELLREHGAVVVAHIFGKGHEVGGADGTDLVDGLEDPLGEVGVYAVHELPLVVEGVEVALDAQEGAGEPEEAVHGEPEGDFATVLFLCPLLPAIFVDGG